jgi:hypothetical protein
MIGDVVDRVQLRHVPSDWVVYSMTCGITVEATAERLRRSAERKGWVVDEGIATEDWKKILAEMTGTWRRARSPGRVTRSTHFIRRRITHMAAQFVLSRAQRFNAS